MSITIVSVRGNGNKAREPPLKQKWDDALFGRGMGASSRMAYWASLWYPQPLPDPVRAGAVSREPEVADRSTDSFVVNDSPNHHGIRGYLRQRRSGNPSRGCSGCSPPRTD